MILGWSNIKNSKPHDILVTGYIPFLNHTQCVERYRAFKMTIYETAFCAGGGQFSQVCHSDSGGPIHSVGEINDKVRMIQYGVFSGIF